MSLIHRRCPRPSPEAVAAIEAADRSHARAVDQLHGVVNLDPEVRAQEALMQAHNLANHWQEWLFETVLPATRRPV